MKIAIAGYGVEGEANYHYWLKKGASITIFDDKEVPPRPLPEGVLTVLGAGAFEKMQGFDMVIRTAGLRPDKIYTDGKVWSATNEFFSQCPAPIIGVTGTKGKGTTCSLITEILRTAGRRVHLVGNIGNPALEVLPEIEKEDVVVFELSSFQLWDIETSPHVAVVLMVEPDHMDVHVSMEEYVAAKGNVTKYQTADDVVIYHPTNEFSTQIAEQSRGKKIIYMNDTNVEAAYTQQGNIMIDGRVICQTDEVGLIGAHNLENICAATTAAWQYTQDISAVKKAVMAFQGLPHRLEFVREVEGAQYYNDSFSSAPSATIAAIRAFTEPIILICGGYNRGLDFTQLATVVHEKQNIKKIVLIGQTAKKLQQALQYAGVDDSLVILSEATSMSQIVIQAHQQAIAGDVVVLSPGCPSFDMFNNFQDRGEQFKRGVEAL